MDEYELKFDVRVEKIMRVKAKDENAAIEEVQKWAKSKGLEKQNIENLTCRWVPAEVKASDLTQ